MTKKPLIDQPLQEQMHARVADRVKWADKSPKNPRISKQAVVGPWTLTVFVGTKWWDWTVQYLGSASGKKAPGIMVVGSGDAQSEAKAMRAASEWLAKSVLDTSDALDIIVKLASLGSKEKLRSPVASKD